MTLLDQWSEPVAEHGEGAVWHEAWGGLRLVDMLAGDVLVMDGGGAPTRRIRVGAVAAVLRPRAAGGMVVGCERSIKVFDEHDRLLSTIRPDLPPGVRFNEGATSADGAFWCGTMAWDEAPGGGALYRVRPDDSRVTEEISSVSVSNGLAFTGGGDRAYYVDSGTGRIDLLELDAGHVAARSTFVIIDAADGVPDGICVDAEDGVWVALWGGGAVRYYDRHGNLGQEIRSDTPFLTSCALGGVDHRDLFVTSSRLESARLGSPADPAGAVFHARVDVPGAPIEEFTG